MEMKHKPRKRVYVCKWTEEENGEYWSTSCGADHCFISDTPEANGYRYCPYCGRKLETKTR